MQIQEARIVLLGAGGQLGRRLQAQAMSLGIALQAFDRHCLNIQDGASLACRLRECSPHIIINAAGYTQVDLAEQAVETAFAVNAAGPGHLAAVAQDLGAVLIQVSTDYVFDGHKSAPYVETDEPNPLGVYGASKLAGEAEVQARCAKHLILRTAWLFDPAGSNFVRTVLRLAHSRSSLRIVADQWGSPTCAQDLAGAVLSMACEALQPDFVDWGLYHYAGSPSVSWFEFAEAIIQAAWQQGLLAYQPALFPIPSAEYACAARRPLNSRLDCSKIAARFGIPPSDWRRALQDLRPYLTPV
ncbi:dTDP-4-dehydrorhamnose reductase [Pseudaeromonas paramecii]|uniref:dTDP-4-dehydrorhamnose reductase n=1 Tax=Pseudaeromonas paramecii TaxID=2138166 RepID=A0ABP8PV44_9GAMM